MQFIKARSDELSALGNPLDHEDLLEAILRGHRHIVEGRDTPISFDELHEKLLNHELYLAQQQPVHLSHPATANVSSARFQHQPPTHPRGSSSRPPSNNTRYAGNSNSRQSKPYLGKCSIV